MAKDLYGKPRGYQKPTFIVLMTTLGIILLLIIVDWGFDVYYQIQTEIDTKASLLTTMKTTGLVKQEDYYDTFYKNLPHQERYNKDILDLRYNEEDGSIVVINYCNYYGFFENITRNIKELKTQRTVKYASYKAYYNKYKEIKIEKYDLLKEQDELEKEENKKLDAE
jgi:hypothetical protein